MRYKTLCYFSIILCFLFSGILHAQMYRVFFADKGNVQSSGDLYDCPVPADYLHSVKLNVDSVYMVSNWLNYALVKAKEYPTALNQFSFVTKVEEVTPLQSIPLALNNNDSVDKESMDKHRQWQLDTMGHPYFQKKKITGKGIIIAIIDAGFNGANESKAFSEIFSTNRVLKTYDFIDNDTDVYHGSSHGTSVWSCIGGNIPGRQTGLATGASFILLRSEDEKKETMADEDRWIQAIEKAYDWGADIVNSSVGFSNLLHKQADLNGQTLISKAADIAAKKGMLVVVAAGNEWLSFWKTLCVPADAEGVIAVGGIDKEGNHSYFSSVGPTADGRAKPDLVAPGTCVVVKGNDLVLVNGTSFAAPLVTGYLACMLELKGKNSFTKDSLKFYGGLYPYFDYVYGYGVPSYFKKDSIHHIDPYSITFNVDKTNHLLRVNVEQDKNMKRIFLKITSPNGEIKFSKIINLSVKSSYKVPVTTKKLPFSYGKYFNPGENDTWSIWVYGHWVEL